MFPPNLMEMNFSKNMKKMKTLFGILTFIFFASSSIAQQDPKAETQRLVALSQKLQGTYQLQIIDSREKTEMPLSLLDSVAAKRHSTDNVYFWYKKNIRVLVLPLSEIEKKDFKPLERIVNISSKNLTK